MPALHHASRRRYYIKSQPSFASVKPNATELKLSGETHAGNLGKLINGIRHRNSGMGKRLDL